MILTNNQVNTRYNNLKRTEKDITTKCDFIYWFVDILGSTDIMNLMLQTLCRGSTTENVARKGQLKTFAATNNKKGVVFVGDRNSGGHYHSMYKGVIQDSYGMGYQIKGSNNFCQLFAIMIYLGTVNPGKYKFDLQPGKYAPNVSVAMRFLKSVLMKNKELRTKIVDDIRVFHSRDHPLDDTWIFLVEKPIQLHSMTVAQLYEYINNVAAHARHFTNC